MNESNHAEFPNGETLSAGATALCSLFLETGELSRLINNIFRNVNAPSFFYIVGLIRELHWMFDDCPPYLTRIEWSVERTRKIDGDRKSVKMHAFRIIEEYNPSPERMATASGIIPTRRETGFSCRQIRLDWPLFARIADFAVNHPEQFDDRLEELFSGGAN